MAGNEYDWKELIYRGIESDTLDYKAAQNWNTLSRGGKAKFVRHCLAMANTKGGFVVVGVGEDPSGQPSNYTGLSEEEAKSFDPTSVGNFINRFADPQIDFTLERPEIDGKRYVVFVIRRFQATPHVCSYGYEHELLQGVFYIRTADASSRPAYRASEIHALIQRALRNQRELLGRMIRGILYEGQNNQPAGNSENHFAEEIGHAKTFFNRRRAPLTVPTVNIELSAIPSVYVGGKYSLSELRRAADEAFEPYYDSDFITEKDIGDAYFTNVSLRSVPEPGIKQWQIFQSGLFYFIRDYELNHNGIAYSVLLRFMGETIGFLAKFYSNLGYAEEIIHIRMSISHVENVVLHESDDSNDNIFVCRIPEINVSLDRSAADLASDPAAHAAQLIKSTCERFNFPDGRHGDLLSTLNRHLHKKD